MKFASLVDMKEISQTLKLMLGDGINIVLCLFILYITLLAVQRFDAFENSYVANALILQCCGIVYLTYRAIRNRHIIHNLKGKIQELKESGVSCASESV